ncbi:hypothetical protein HKD37_01G002835 [Glycine soja]|uniref:uncharacterized protein n=1 Tax=Glycine max TaxID=3847 RepID=UPI00023BD9FD|nr:uncharacterized protein LOC100804615 [Glycine max]KAH1267725.1 hypothetical protein GmHk_01G002881 [Glycine max]|eukprot:XP_006573848.1 uncharacterized protein LOC100804615 isoform X1 [Glycine max]
MEAEPKFSESEVVRQIDVFFSPSVGAQTWLYVFRQLSTSPRWRPYSLDEQCQEEVRFNPKHSEFKLDLAIDKEFNQTFSTLWKPYKSVPYVEPGYAVGLLMGDKLHLHPIHEVVHHLNSAEKSVSTSKEQWVPLKYLSCKSDISCSYLQQMVVAEESSSTNNFTMSANDYVTALCTGGSSNNSPKVERKSSVEVAFSLGSSSSHSLGTYGTSKSVDSGTSSGSPSKDQEDQNDASNAFARKIKEQWDYENSYNATLGDSEIHDAEEYDENSVNSAAELRILEKSEDQRMFFFKIPAYLPGTSTVSGEPTHLKDLPRGYMGKMLVYKSGAINLKLGESLFDVYPGSNRGHVEDVVAVNTQKQCCNLGKISKRVNVTPNIDFLDKYN